MPPDPNSYSSFGDILNYSYNNADSINDNAFEKLQNTSDYLYEESKYDNNFETVSRYRSAEQIARENQSKSKEDENLYGFIPGEWLPDWVKAGYNQSIQGMAQQLVTGKATFDLSDYDSGILEDVGATLVSFLQPVDMATMFAGGGVGGLTLKASMKQGVKLAVKEGLKQKAKKKVITKALDGKIVNAIAGAESKKAANLMMMAGVKKKVAEKVVKKATPRVLNRALAEGVTGATGLGFYSGLSTGLGTKIATGDVDTVLALKEASKGAVLGGLTAGTGVVANSILGSTLKGSTKAIAVKAIEAGEFGTLAPMLSGDAPSLESYAHAAGVIGGLTAQKYAFGQARKGMGSIKNAKKESLFGSKEYAKAELESAKERIELDDVYTNKDGKEYKGLQFNDKDKTVTMESVSSKDQTKISYEDFNAGVFKRGGRAKTEQGLKRSRIGRIMKTQRELDIPLEKFRDMVNNVKVEGKAKLKNEKSTGVSDLSRIEQLKLLNELSHQERITNLKSLLDANGWEGHLLADRGWFDHIMPSIPRGWRRLKKRGQTQISSLAFQDYNKFDARELTLLGEVLQGFHSNGLYKSGLFKGKKHKKYYEKLADRLENPDHAGDKDVVAYRDLLESMWQKATDAGIDLGPKQEFYFPHMIKPEYLKIFSTDVAKVGEANLSPELLKNPAFQKTIGEMVKDGGFDKATVSALEQMAGIKLDSSGAKPKDYDARISKAYGRLFDIMNTQVHSVAKNLEFARKQDQLPKEFMERDSRLVLTRYAKQWARRVAFVKTFGKKGEVMTDRFKALTELSKSKSMNDASKNKIRQEKDMLEMSFDALTNRIELNPEHNWKSPNAREFWSDLVNFEIGTKIGLGFATIPNLTQLTVSTAVKTGYWPMFKAMYKLSRPTSEGKEYRADVKKSGASMLSVFQMMAGLEPTDSNMARFAEFTTKWSGFQKINEFNQLVSAATAREYITKLQNISQGKGSGKISVRKNWARETLKDFGIEDHNTDFNSKAGARLMRESMYKFARDAQLQRNILEEPLAFNDPRFRPFFLFKKFGYKQASWIKDQLKAEAKRGNFAPMLRLGMSGMAGGEMVMWARDKYAELIAGEPVYDENEYMFSFLKPNTPMSDRGPEQFIDMSKFQFSDYIDRFGAVGAMGMITDIVANENKIRALEFIGKPAIVQDFDKLWTAMTKTIEGIGDYGAVGSAVRLPKYIGPMLGTIPRRALQRFEKKYAKGQRETYIKYRKGLTTSKALDHIIDGNSAMAIRIINSWNSTYSENPILGENIGGSAIYKRLKTKAEKRAKP